MAEQIVRCPYRVLGYDFRPMVGRMEGWFACLKCGHNAMPGSTHWVQRFPIVLSRLMEQAECDQCLRERAVFSERIEGGSSGVVPHAAPKVQRFSKCLRR